MNQTQPAQPWYKVWWKLILFILFFAITVPVYALWYIWKKAKWTTLQKGVATAIVLLLTVIIWAGSESQSDSKKVLDETIKADQASEPITTNSVSTSSTPTAFFLVSRVIDGDTFDVEIDGNTERIRLIGVDTPETVDPREPVQCFGKEASERTNQLIEGKRVTLETDSSQGERDRYGRLLRHVFLSDGRNLGLVLIGEGYAHEYTFSTAYRYQQAFKDAEKLARENELGLWADGTCGGSTAAPSTTPASSVSAPVPQPDAPAPTTDGPPVKKSTSNICHAIGTRYYKQTKNFTSYSTIQACLDSGGRMPE